MPLSVSLWNDFNDPVLDVCVICSVFVFHYVIFFFLPFVVCGVQFPGLIRVFNSVPALLK